MLIAGIHTLTLLDFPDQVACIIFTAGCNMRCGYCHNPHIVLPDEIRRQKDFIPVDKFFHFLETRKGFIDGVVISGGEPTVHHDLLDFIRQIKQQGFLVKLDTNGTKPELLQTAFNEGLLDYVAMDIKSSPQKYSHLAGVKVNMQNISQSRDLIVSSGVDYEFRTTLIKGYHSLDEIHQIGEFCRGANKSVSKYIVQNFRPESTLDPAFQQYTGFSPSELQTIKTQMETYVKTVEVSESFCTHV